MFIGFGGRLFFQFYSFVLLARYLGPSQFGEFSSALSLVTLIAPFVDLGSFNLIIQDITQGKKTSLAMGNSLFISVFSFPIGILLICILRGLLIPDISIKLLISLGLAEFIGIRFSQIAFGVHFAHSQLWRNAVFEISSGCIRLLFVFLLINWKSTLSTWGYLYAIQTLFMGITILCFAFYSWGKPKYNFQEVKKRIIPGFHFASGMAAQSAGSDIDKTLLARLANFDAAGIYSAAQRFIIVSYLPLNAFLSAVYPKFFQFGAKGYSYSRDYAVKILPITLAYGIFSASILYFFSNLLDVLLGLDFNDSKEAIRILAIIPIIQSIFFPFADALAGGGRQLFRTKILILGLFVNIIFNLIFIPKLGWKAAAYGSIISQTLVVIFVLIYSFKYSTLTRVSHMDI